MLKFSEKNMKKGIKDEKDQTDSWIESCLELSPRNESLLKDLYLAYSNEFSEKRLVPEGKITFSRKMRRYLKPFIEGEQIRVRVKDGILIKGISLKAAKVV